MERGHLLGVFLAALCLTLLSACGDSGGANEGGPRNIPFTPAPTPTAVPKQCGNQVLDPGEECDPPEVSACGAGASCVCCVCLADGEELGDRVFTLARKMGNEAPRGTTSFGTSVLGGADISQDPWLLGPLTLHAGRPDPNAPPAIEFPSDDDCPTPPGDLPREAACSAPLTLATDGLFGFNDPLGGTFCGKFFAEKSTGFIDCDGGSAHDVTVSVDSMGLADAGPTMICRNQGDPLAAGAGAATLRIDNSVLIRVPCQQTPCPMEARLLAADLCPTLNYDDPFDPAQIAQYNISLADILVGPVVLTTTRASGTVLNPNVGGTAQTTPIVLPPVTGQNFVCSRFSQTDSEGGLVTDVAGLENPLANGDTMNGVRLFDANQF